MLPQVPLGGGLGHMVAVGLPTTDVPNHGCVSYIMQALPGRYKPHEKLAVFPRKVRRIAYPCAVIHNSSPLWSRLCPGLLLTLESLAARRGAGWFRGSTRERLTWQRTDSTGSRKAHSMPPEQKVGGSNPLGRTKSFKSHHFPGSACR